MSKNTKPEPKTTKTETAAVKNDPPTVSAPVLTSDLIAALRSAESVEAGVKILQPDSKPKARLDASYILNTSCVAPLPQKRGACLKVVTAAVRFDRPFKVADVVAQLPDVKSAAYWTRKLAKTGHLVEV